MDDAVVTPTPDRHCRAMLVFAESDICLMVGMDCNLMDGHEGNHVYTGTDDFGTPFTATWTAE